MQIHGQNQFFPAVFQESPVFSLQSLTFLFFNLVTLGISGTAQLVWQDKKIKRIHLQEKKFENEVAKLIAEMNTLETNIQRLRGQILRGEAGNCAQLEGEIRNLSQKYEEILQRLNENFSIELSVVWVVGHLFFNIITLGAYTLYKSRQFERQIYSLESENGREREGGRLDFHDHEQRLLRQTTSIQDLIQANQATAEAMNGEKGRAAKELYNLQEQKSLLQNGVAGMRNERTAWETKEPIVITSIQQMRDRSQEIAQTIAQLDLEYNQLQERYPLNLNPQQINDLRERVNLRNDDANQLTTLIDEENQLELELLGLKQNLKEEHRPLLKIEPLPLTYTKRAQDGEIAGAYGLEEMENDDALMSDYARRYNGKQTATAVIQAGMEYAIEELVRLGEQANPQIHFNRSFDLVQNEDYSLQKVAVYRFLAFDFIKHAKLFQSSHGYQLKLNKDGITMGSSLPFTVKSIRLAPHTQERIPVEKIIFSHLDDFSPPIGSRDLVRGIDPVNATWIFAQLDQNEKLYLFCLLMDPLIANDDVDLQNTKKFMKEGEISRVKLVETAYGLICDLAFSFKDFPLNEQWGLLDEWDANVKPFSKEIQNFASRTENTPLPIVEWTPHYDSLGASFGANVRETVTKLKALYAEMTPEVINNKAMTPCISELASRNIGGRKINGLDAQFKSKHPMLGGHGCLMSTLTSLAVSKKDKVAASTTQNLKNAMANYLDIPENAQNFAGKIAQVHKNNQITLRHEVTKNNYHPGMTVEQYQRWLRNSRVHGDPDIYNPSLGEVEIELFACLLGVQVVVFHSGVKTKIDNCGLTIPQDESCCFGPRTKEKLFIFNNTNATYYCLWPLLNENGYANNDTQDLCKEMMDYVCK